MRYPTFVKKKIQELSFYPYEVIIETLEGIKDSLKYQLSLSGKFQSENGKVHYIYGAINNHINEVYFKWKRKQNQLSKQIRVPIDLIDVSVDLEQLGADIERPIKDITKWLEGDDL